MAWKKNSLSVFGGGSVTCGVDSLYSIWMHRNEMTHLIVNKCHGETDVKDKEVLFRELIESARKFCEEGGYTLIIGDTNYDGACIPGLCFEGKHTYANLFAVYAMQKLFRIYYVATGCSLKTFSLSDFHSLDCVHYDLLTTYTVSTSKLSIISDGMVPRLEKVRRLVDWELAQRHLDVCWNGHNANRKNGTYDCPKCMRTVLEILAIGGSEALKKFAYTFDVDYVLTHKEEFLAELIRGKIQDNEFALETWPHRTQMGFSYMDYLCAFRIVFRKMIKKMLRFGQTSHRFSPRG